MDTALILTFLVRYIAFFAVVIFAGAIVLGSAFIVLKNRLLEGEVLGSGALQTSAEGSAY